MAAGSPLSLFRSGENCYLRRPQFRCDRCTPSGSGGCCPAHATRQLAGGVNLTRSVGHEDRSLNIDTFDPIDVLMRHALPKEAQCPPVQRAGFAQAGVHPQFSNRGETPHLSGSISFWIRDLISPMKSLRSTTMLEAPVVPERYYCCGKQGPRPKGTALPDLPLHFPSVRASVIDTSDALCDRMRACQNER